VADDRQRVEEIFSGRRNLTDRYTLSNPGNAFNYRQLYAIVEDSLRSHAGGRSLSDMVCLDIGSGSGFWAWQLTKMGVAEEKCTATDLLMWRLQEGVRQKYQTPRVCCSADRLPFLDNSIDIVSQFTLFTSLLDDSVRSRTANEIARVLHPDGVCLWYDFRYNNPKNPHTRAIGRSELRSLFSGWPIQIRTLTLLPPLARKIPAPLGFLLKSLRGVPMLRSHLFAIIGPREK
jgi:ubiquinone/menaquinone biosynthesis C-methylase UbiE